MINPCIGDEEVFARFYGVVRPRAGYHYNSGYGKCLVHLVGLIVLLIIGGKFGLAYHQPIGVEGFVGIVIEADVLIIVILLALVRKASCEEDFGDDEVLLPRGA